MKGERCGQALDKINSDLEGSCKVERVTLRRAFLASVGSVKQF